MLVAALAATGAVAAVNWWTRVHTNRRLEAVSKPLTTVLVIVVALAAGGSPGATTLAVIALLCCLAGDIALLDAVDQFVAGLAAFLVGHVLFVVMFVVAGLEHPWWGVVAGALMAVENATVTRRIVAGAALQDPALRLPVIAYTGTISAMAIVAAMTGRPWAIAGALLFVASDSVLGWRTFVADRRWLSLAVMVTYHGAITSLAISLR